MNKSPLLIATIAAALATLSPQASACDPVPGAIIGGGIGAVIGNGPGAAVGAVIGSALAASAPCDDRYYGRYYPEREYADRGYYARRYEERRYYAPAPAYYAPAPVYYAPAPVYYAPAPVYYAPAAVIVYRGYSSYGYGPRHGSRARHYERGYRHYR
jgi:hypothetical protein